MAPGAMVLGAGVLVGALVARPTAFVEAAHERVDERPRSIQAAASGEVIEVRLDGAGWGPDLIVYSAPVALEGLQGGSELPAGATQLGPMIPGVVSTFENPGGGRTLAVYSLGHGEVESWASLPAPEEER